MTDTAQVPPVPNNQDLKQQSSLPPKKRLAQLIGKRCMVTCALSGAPIQILLYSGAQVTMVGKTWMQRSLPNVQIQPFNSLLSDQSLEIFAANGTDVPLEGWADVALDIKSNNHGHVTIQVPVLVTQICLN